MKLNVRDSFTQFPCTSLPLALVTIEQRAKCLDEAERGMYCGAKDAGYSVEHVQCCWGLHCCSGSMGLFIMDDHKEVVDHCEGSSTRKREEQTSHIWMQRYGYYIT